MKIRSLMTALVASLALTVSASIAVADEQEELHSPKTWQTVVLARWKGRVEVTSKGQLPGVEFEAIRDITTGQKCVWRSSHGPIVYDHTQKLEGDVGDLRYLALSQINSHTMIWKDIKPDVDLTDYIDKMPKWNDKDVLPFLEYHLTGLSSDNQIARRISSLAFEKASVEHLLQYGKHADAKVARDRLDLTASDTLLFGSLSLVFASSGDANAVEYLRMNIVDTPSGRMNTRLIIAYLSVAGESGLDRLEAFILPHKPPSGVGNLIEALDLIAESDTLRRERILSTIRKCVSDHGFDTVAIETLIHKNDWGMLTSLFDLYRKSDKRPDLQRVIVRYAMCCIKHNEQGDIDPTVVNNAKSVLDQMRLHSPKPVLEVEEYFREAND